MQLTREQAIAEHRKMWNWIADQIETLKFTLDIYGYKKEYCSINGCYWISNWCFLCEYTNNDCNLCPLEWGKSIPYQCEGEIGDQCNQGLWWKCLKAETWQEQAALARQIANLPERTDV